MSFRDIESEEEIQEECEESDEEDLTERQERNDEEDKKEYRKRDMKRTLSCYQDEIVSEIV